MVTTELKTHLGVAIKSERSSLGISQEELAERAGLHRTYVSDVERGARNPSIATVGKLAEALRVPIAALFERGTPQRVGEVVEILLVEEDAKDVEMTRNAFKNARIANPLHVVRDGLEALDFLFATGSFMHRAYTPLPLLIMLDLNLPRKRGLEVVERIKGDKLTRDIFIAVMTASTREADLAECRRLGVESYLVKPVGFDNLRAMIAKMNLVWTMVKPAQTK